MKEGMHNQYGDLPWVARLIYLIYPLAVIWLVFWSEQIDSEDTLTISAILVVILALVTGIDAWKAYLGHLKLESDRIEARQKKLEEEEQARKDALIAQDDKRKKEAKEHEDNIKKIFTELFNSKIEALVGYAAEKTTRDELLRLAKELKTTTEEYYNSECKQTKVTTQSVPDDVREKILKAYPVLSHLKPEEPRTDGN